MRDDYTVLQQASSINRLALLAQGCAYIGGAASIMGIVFMTAFLFRGGVFGPLSDIAVIVQFTLMLPITVLVYKLVRPFAPGVSQIAAVIGIGGILAVIVLQALLVFGVLPFSQQIWMVIPAFLTVLAWFILTERLGRHMEVLPKGIFLYILAGLSVGYPVWAFSLARRLRFTA